MVNPVIAASDGAVRSVGSPADAKAFGLSGLIPSKPERMCVN